jgi:hypothetical protein
VRRLLAIPVVVATLAAGCGDERSAVDHKFGDFLGLNVTGCQKERVSANGNTFYRCDHGVSGIITSDGKIRKIHTVQEPGS